MSDLDLIALVKEGKVAVVLAEATPEIVAAFWRQKNTGTQELGSWGDATSDYDAYRAMLSAAPPLTPALLALAEERDRLREALAFYANEDNYADRLVTRTCGCCSDHEPAAIGSGGSDEGEIARAALARALTQETRHDG